MRRVVVTGMGIVSCMGTNIGSVLRSLREGRSGLQRVPEMKELGYKCPVAGLVKALDTEGLRKKSLQTMSDTARYATVAALEAIEDARIAPEMLRSAKAGVVVGTGVGGLSEASMAEAHLLAHQSPARLGATGLVKIMTSSAALNLAARLGVRGRCYSVSSACCTGTDSIGHGFELIRHGVLDVCIAGASEENGARHAWAFFSSFGISASELDPPEGICRPYDRARRGTVVSEGAGILVLESLDHAEQRGAPVVAEVIGYGSANDGAGMFEPTGRGLKRAIELALESAESDGELRIDYINSHSAGTKIGDPVEVQVIREVFMAFPPLVSSTKPLNGHSLGAAGAHEAIFTLLMLQHGFVVPTANLEQVAPECAGIRHVHSMLHVPLRTVLSFNSGLGGTNACLIFQKLER